MKCILCNCSDKEDEGAQYRECLLFDNNLICDICCNFHDETILRQIKKITGKKLAMDEILQTCKKCGKSDVENL